MATPLAVFSADWHIAPSAWKSRYPGLSGDAYYGLEQLAAIANKLRIPILGGGDLFDNKNPDSRSVDTVCQILKSVEYGVYYIQGDHELASPPWLRALSRGEWIHNKIITLGGYKVYGLDFAPSKQSMTWLKEMPENIDFLLTHQKWKDLVPNLSGDCLSFNMIPYAMTLLTGDCHTSQTGQYQAANGATGRFVSPGTLCVQEISESPAKSVRVINTDGSIEAVGIRSRRVERIGIESEEQLTEWLLKPDSELFGYDPEIPEALRKPLLEVKYDSSIPLAHERIVERLSSKCYFTPIPVLMSLRGSVDWAAVPETYVSPVDLITADVLKSMCIPGELWEYARLLWQARDDKELSAVISSLKFDVNEVS